MAAIRSSQSTQIPPMRPVLSRKLVAMEQKKVQLEEERRARKRRNQGRQAAPSFGSTARLVGETVSSDMTMRFVIDMVPGELHSKRVESIAGGVAGVLEAGSMAVIAIGKGCAAFHNGSAKHGIRQVDRMLSSGKIDVDDFLPMGWIRAVFLSAKGTINPSESTATWGGGAGSRAAA